MNEFANDFLVDGSSALNPVRKNGAKRAVIIEFPTNRTAGKASRCALRKEPQASAPIVTIASRSLGARSGRLAASAETPLAIASGSGLPVKSSQAGANRKAGWLNRTLDKSEMYCSLAFEDFRGVAYGMLSHKAVAALATASALIAIISIAISA